ncbi:MAG: hypothetical protein EXR75_06740 [Myxococcales bacterium]|nr:hypothetical protein [Myxococcales bacterium]
MRARGFSFGGFALVLGLGGCNAITGADDLVASPDFGAPSDDGNGGPQTGGGGFASSGTGFDDAVASSQASSGTTGGAGGAPTTSAASSGAGVSTAASSGAGSSVASTGAGGGGPPPPPPPPPVGDAADGVSVVDAKIYQAIEIPLMQASSIPVVAKRDAMVRVFFKVLSGYNGQPVTARFSAGQYYVEKSQVLSGASTQASLASTVNLQIPGYMLTVGGTFRIDLVQPQSSGTNSAAGYPPGTQQVPHNAKSSGDTLKIVLVPVQNDGTLPDTSPAQVQKYLDYFRWQYPVPSVEVTVRSQPFPFNGYLGGFNGWSDLLDEISQLRDQDGVADPVYYYGIHDADGNGLLGLGWVADANDPWSRAAIGVGWTGNTAPETAVHEIGHTHGRQHSPCGVDGDPAYPHYDGVIGVWGYHPGAAKLLPPNDYVDFMSYCAPAWVSDHTYKALFNRLKHVNGAKIEVSPELVGRMWDRVRVLNGQATWLASIKMQRPPVGVEKTIMLESDNGKSAATGHYYPYNHLDGGVLFILRPKHMLKLDVWKAIDFAIEGRSVRATR